MPKLKSPEDLVPIPDGMFIIDKILDHKPKNAKGEKDAKEYFIKWKNYDKKHNTWEPADGLKEDVPRVIKKYWKGVLEARSRDLNNNAIQVERRGRPRKFIHANRKKVTDSVPKPSKEAVTKFEQTFKKHFAVPKAPKPIQKSKTIQKQKTLQFGIQQKRKKTIIIPKIEKDMFGDVYKYRDGKISGIRYQTTDGCWHWGQLNDMKVKGHSNMTEKLRKEHNFPENTELAFKIKDSNTKTYFLLPICETKASHQMQYFLQQQIKRYCDKYQAEVDKFIKKEKEEVERLNESKRVKIDEEREEKFDAQKSFVDESLKIDAEKSFEDAGLEVDDKESFVDESAKVEVGSKNEEVECVVSAVKNDDRKSDKLCVMKNVKTETIVEDETNDSGLVADNSTGNLVDDA